MTHGECKLTVTFDDDLDEQTSDGGEPYALRLAKVCQRWEHDCPRWHDVDPDSWDEPKDPCRCDMKGLDFEGETLWEVSADFTTFTCYSDMLEPLRDVINAVIMNTIPRHLELEVGE